MPCVLIAVESAHQARHWRVEDLTHPQESCHRDGSAGLDLLLMVESGEAERDHVFLGQAARLAQVPYASAQRGIIASKLKHGQKWRRDEAEGRQR